MTKTSAQRWLRHRLGPEVRVIAREGDVRIVHEKGGVQTLIGRGVTVDAAFKSLLGAAADVVGAKPSLTVRAKARTPWEAFALTLRTLWGAVWMLFARRRQA